MRRPALAEAIDDVSGEERDLPLIEMIDFDDVDVSQGALGFKEQTDEMSDRTVGCGRMLYFDQMRGRCEQWLKERMSDGKGPATRVLGAVHILNGVYEDAQHRPRLPSPIAVRVQVVLQCCLERLANGRIGTQNHNLHRHARGCLLSYGTLGASQPAAEHEDHHQFQCLVQNFGLVGR